LAGSTLAYEPVVEPTQRIVPPSAGDGAGFGEILSAAGDLNGDGFDDVVVLAPWQDLTPSGWGAVYVLYGSNLGLDAAGMRELTPPSAD